MPPQKPEKNAGEPSPEALAKAHRVFFISLLLVSIGYGVGVGAFCGLAGLILAVLGHFGRAPSPDSPAVYVVLFVTVAIPSLLLALFFGHRAAHSLRDNLLLPRGIVGGLIMGVLAANAGGIVTYLNFSGLPALSSTHAIWAAVLHALLTIGAFTAAAHMRQVHPEEPDAEPDLAEPTEPDDGLDPDDS